MSNPFPNDLDRAILRARAGTITKQQFVKELVKSQLAVPSLTDAGQGIGAVRPVLLDKGNATFVAAFSDVAFTQAFQHLAGYCLSIEVLAWLRVLPRDLGLVINPGMEASIEFSAEGVQQIVRSFSPIPIN